MHRNSKYLKKFFISYILLLIPSFLIFMFAASGIFSILREGTRSSLEIKLEHVKSKYELKYQFFELLSLRISLDDEMSTNKIVPDKYSSLRSIQKLQNIKSYDAMITDIFLCFDDANVYTTNGMSRIETYMLRYLKLSTTDSILLFRNMLFDMNTKGVYLLQNSGNLSYLVYHFPVSMERNYNFASVNFLVELSAIKNILNDLPGGYDSYVGIEFPTGETIVFEEDQHDYSIYIYNNFFDAIKNPHDYTTLNTVSDKTNITFYTAYRTNLMYSQIIKLQTYFYLMLVILLFIALITSFAFSKRNSYPILQLVKTFTEIRAENKSDKLVQNQDEIRLIHDMLSITIDENKKMKQAMKNSRMLLSQQTMLLLFHGILNNSAVIYKMMEVSDLELDESCFCVLLIGIQEYNELSSERIHQCYEELWQLPDCEMGCSVTIDGKEVMALLIEVPNQDLSRIHRMAVCKRISSACTRHDLEPVYFSFSRVYEDIEQINQAYIEAIYVFKLNLSKTNFQAVTFFDDILTFDLPIVQLSKKESDIFCNAIRSLDKSKIFRSFNYIMQQIDKEDNSIEIQFSLRFYVLNMVLRCLIEMGIEQEILTDILYFDPLNENKFNQQMYLLFEKICLLSNPPVEKTVKDILHYIHENYKDMNLSLENVASYVGLSKAYVSRLFKSKIGKKYIDYLTDIRMQKAMQLLSSTDMTVKDIIQQIGYCDVRSFQKKFKLLYGLTPAKYRELNNRNQVSNQVLEV